MHGDVFIELLLEKAGRYTSAGIFAACKAGLVILRIVAGRSDEPRISHKVTARGAVQEASRYLNVQCLDEVARVTKHVDIPRKICVAPAASSKPD